MSLRQVGVLIAHETTHGSRNFFFILAIVTPIAVSFLFSAIFGTFFVDTPTLGIFDPGQSRFIGLASDLDSIDSQVYGSADRLRDATESGAVDVGVLLPDGFDERVASGQSIEVPAYIWGESLSKNRAIAGAAVASLVRDIAGQEIAVEIVSITVGEGEAVPIQDRLLPLIVLLAVAFGGVMVPAASLVDERHKRTLNALTVTPTTLEEVFTAKAIVGFVLSLVMGLLILILNQAFGEERLLLITVLTLGAIFASAFGVLLGLLSKDITTLFATIKAIGLLLYAPAIVFMFPTIPQWIGRLFPTYYVVGPLVDVSQRGAGWEDVGVDLLILIALIAVEIGAVVMVARRVKLRDL